MPDKTTFLASYFHTPSETAQQCFYMVLRAGKVRTASSYRIKRHHYPGHDLIYCTRGVGFVRCGTRQFQVPTGHLAWIDGHHPHAHWPDPEHPWELLWVRLDGRQLDGICKVLSIKEAPVFSISDPAFIARTFQHILRLMRLRPLAMEALLHAEVAGLIGHLFEVRQTERAQSDYGEPTLPHELRQPFTSMCLYYHRPWRVPELARMANMSVPQFFRRFRQATGSTPIDWLRRERINQAKRRLLESSDSIQEISEQVGYADQFYFSRDFKRLTGVSPSRYRRQELSHLRQDS